MPSKADIKSKVESAFARAGDVIFIATLKREGSPTYNPATASVTTTPSTSTCKLLFDRSRQVMSTFLSGMTIEPNDQIAWMQGPTFVPNKGDLLEVTGMPTRTIVFAEDILQLGALHLVVAR